MSLHISAPDLRLRGEGATHPRKFASSQPRSVFDSCFPAVVTNDLSPDPHMASERSWSGEYRTMRQMRSEARYDAHNGWVSWGRYRGCLRSNVGSGMCTEQVPVCIIIVAYPLPYLSMLSLLAFPPAPAAAASGIRSHISIKLPPKHQQITCGHLSA